MSVQNTDLGQKGKSRRMKYFAATKTIFSFQALNKFLASINQSTDEGE